MEAMMRRRAVFVGLMIAALVWAPAVWATTYAVDPEHSTVSFRIRHLFSYVRGTFDRFEGTFEYVPGHPEAWTTSATIYADSIDTRVQKRDDHLRSPEFFDVQRFPTIAFKSTGVTAATATGAKLQGLLTIHGVERSVTLDLAIHGEGKDPWGKVRSGVTATTTINRKDFGLTWNKAVETGQLVVGDEVEIALEVEGVANP